MLKIKLNVTNGFPVSFAEHFKKNYNKNKFTNSYKVS